MTMTVDNVGVERGWVVSSGSEGGGVREGRAFEWKGRGDDEDEN